MLAIASCAAVNESAGADQLQEDRHPKDLAEVLLAIGMTIRSFLSIHQSIRLPHSLDVVRHPHVAWLKVADFMTSLESRRKKQLWGVGGPNAYGSSLAVDTAMCRGQPPTYMLGAVQIDQSWPRKSLLAGRACGSAWDWWE